MMGTAWRGIGLVWLVYALVLLVSCSSKPPVQVSLAPQTQALEQTYQAGRVAFKEQRYDDAAAQFARQVAADLAHLKAGLSRAAAMPATGQPAAPPEQCHTGRAHDPA